MEGAAAERVRGLTADKDEYYELIWENLARKFGHIDEPERAKRRFDNKKQLESETMEVFEQGLRTVFREAWPTGDPKSKENDSMLQRRFVDGLFDPALQQFLRLHARTDDFVTTVGKARQYMDAQEQAKVSAISKKPNVRFAATEDQIESNSFSMDYRKYYRRCWTIRIGHLRLTLVRRYREMEVSRKEKGKVTRLSCQLIMMPPPALLIQTPDTESKSLEDGPMKLQLSDHKMITSFLDGTKDAKEISLIVPPLPIVNSDSRFRNEISKHEDPDGTQVFLLVLQTLAQEDRKIDLSEEDAMCVDNRTVIPLSTGMIALHHQYLEVRQHLRQYQTDHWNQSYLSV